MRILVLNCGSSTLKFRLADTDSVSGATRHIADGTVDRVGGRATLAFSASETLKEEADVPDHAAAARRALAWLRAAGLADDLDAVGHRVVHGADRFAEPVVIDETVAAAIEELVELAPLHNGPALQAIHAAREALPGVPMAATFDTAFHRTLPDRAGLYAIPLDLAERHHIRRYGFHGLAHRYMAGRYVEITGTPAEAMRIVTLQLGAGCSATAVDGGRSVDTSMGFTPLEGLMMATRSGDVDPSLPGFLARAEGVTVDEVEDRLNTRSGLLGVSGRSGDMRELLRGAGEGDRRCALAVDMFCYRARKYVGAYLAALGGADALVFGGGIGENAPEVRARICEGLAWSGLRIDAERNRSAVGAEAHITGDDSTPHAYVIPVDEASVIVRDTFEVLQRH